MIALIGWIGALCMAGAPFIIDTDAGKIIAIAGLLMLTQQAAHGKLWNLVCLNIAGILGYSYALYL